MLANRGRKSLWPSCAKGFKGYNPILMGLKLKETEKKGNSVPGSYNRCYHFDNNREMVYYCLLLDVFELPKLGYSPKNSYWLPFQVVIHPDHS